MRRFRFPGVLTIPLAIAVYVLLFGGGLPASAQVPAGTIWFVDDSINDGLAAHWKFDEVGAGTALEFIVGADGSLASGASMAATPLPPVLFNDTASLTLDGAAGRVDIADNPSLNLSASFTVAAWVKRNAIDVYHAVYDSGEQANHWWVFISDLTKGNLPGLGARGLTEIYGSQPITDFGWHHIVVVKNGDTGVNVTFYTDGVATGGGSIGALTLPSGVKRIGALFEGSPLALFNGNIDDLRLYNRALSASEVQRLAQGRGCVTEGTAWSTAFRELQCSLSTAAAGDQIWIGEGVYKPGVSAAQSFILKNGVDIFGGFLGLNSGGGETALVQRPAFNADAPLTILSGDVLGDDLPATFANYGDNAFHVITAGTGVSASLDRLGIHSGSATGAGPSEFLGGGMLVQADAGTIQLIEVAFFANQGILGGGIATTVPLTITGGRFDNNRATTFDGGAIQSTATSGTLAISQSTFTGNVAAFNGGAISAGPGALNINQCSFQDNQAHTFGGGAISTVGVLDIQNSIFNSNKSQFNGGAIEGGSTSVTVLGSQLTGNQALGANCIPACSNGDGGAIFARGPLTVANTTLTNNFARLKGGAISGEGVTMVSDSLLTGNQAGTPGDVNNPGKGGAVYVTGEATLSNNVLEINAAQSPASDGGGLFGENGPVLSTGNRFSGNTSTRFGGGARLPSAQVKGDRYLNNTAASEGGGILGSGNLTITQTIFDGNASNLSGALSAQGPAHRSLQVNIDNSLFIRNQLQSTAGVADLRLFDLTGKLVNNTFADTGSAGALSLKAFRSDLHVENNIFAHYGNSIDGDTGPGGLPVQEDYNLFFNAPLGPTVTSGGHSLTGNPLFVDPAAQNYRLASGSPAIGAGLDSALPASMLNDLSGGLRRVGPIDIGAYESQNLLFLPLILRNAL